MSAKTAALAKPQTIPKPEPRTVQIMVRLTPASRERIRALALEQGVTIQQLGAYGWSLALESYGQPPLTEAAA